MVPTGEVASVIFMFYKLTYTSGGTLKACCKMASFYSVALNVKNASPRLSENVGQGYKKHRLCNGLV